MKLFSSRRDYFPDPRLAGPDGLVAFSETLELEALFEAYSYGIFPWPHEGYPLLWFCPKSRGVLEFDQIRISRSLRRHIGKCDWILTVDTAFDQVIQECAKKPRPGQDGTWITDEIKSIYVDFHRAGYAHSFECWQDDELIGGMYGVYIGGSFSGESMFFHRSEASKVCLLHAIDLLSAEGLSWMDCQMVTPFTEQVGGHYISRSQFLDRLEESKKRAQLINFKSRGPSKVRDRLTRFLRQTKVQESKTSKER